MTETPRPPRADPAIEKLLEVLGRDHAHQLRSRSVEEAVRMLRSTPPQPAATLAARVEDRVIQVRGRAIPVRMAWPDPSSPDPLPILMNFHGGGWVTGSCAGDDLRCQRLTVMAGCITISVDYRMAPEHLYPVPFEDCYDATWWAADNAASIGGDPSRIAVSGASAGANLAAAVAARGRAQRDDRFPIFQLLFYPVLDARTQEGDIEGGPFYLSRDAMNWYWDRYLAPNTDRDDPWISPLSPRSDFAAMPPTTIIAAELDPLRDEAERFTRALRKAGVECDYVQMPGVIHGFISFCPEIRQTHEALEVGAKALCRAFASRGHSPPWAPE